MNYMYIDKCSVCDGLGCRVVLYVSGCTLNCPNCHNPETHNFNAGRPFTAKTLETLLSLLQPDYVSGLTISGGNPLEDRNILQVQEILSAVKSSFPDKKIWVYTGFTLEELEKKNIDLSNIDYLVDGRYEDNNRDITLAFRGSNNQRIIDVKKRMDIWE